MKIFIIILFLSIDLFSQTTYYFSTDGDDANSGLSSALPKETLSAANVIINNAVPGDTILFKRGDTWTTRAGTYALDLQGVQGTLANPIVINAYGTGGKPKFLISGTASIIRLFSGSVDIVSYYVEIRNLQLVSTAVESSKPAFAIDLRNSGSAATSPHHITLDSLLIDGTRSGVNIGVPNQYVTITNSIIQNTEGGHTDDGQLGEGVKGTSRGSIIENCTFINNGWDADPIGRQHCVYLSGGGSDSTFVRNNIFRDSKQGIALANGDSCFIEDNQFINIETSAIGISSRAQGTGFLVYLLNTFIRRNSFIGCTYGIVATQSVTTNPETGHTYTQVGEIVNNIFINGFMAIRFIESSANPDPIHFEDFLIANNTIANCSYGIQFHSGTFDSIEVYNNIFYNDTYSSGVLFNAKSSHLTNIITNYNLYYNTVGNTFRISDFNYTLSAFKIAFESDEQNSISDNPDFSNPAGNVFGLLAGSPAIDNNGTSLAGIVDEDFVGLSRPQNLIWDLGAYEYDSESEPALIVSISTAGRWGWDFGIPAGAATPELTVRIASIDFGADDSSSIDETYQFYLVNISDEIVTVSDFSGLASPYSDDYTPGTIGVDDSVLVTITFDRNQSGAVYNDTISITSDGGNYTIPVTGIAYTYYTFGKTDNGSSELSTVGGTGRKAVSSFTSGAAGVITQLTVYSYKATTNFPLKGVVYSDVTGSPSALLATGNEVAVDGATSSNTEISTFATPLSITATTTYWLGAIYAPAASETGKIRRDGTANEGIFLNDAYSDGAADPFGSGTLMNGKVAVYATVRVPQ